MVEPRKLRVFLCHASQDKPVVRELYQHLLAEDWIDPWLDEEKLLPGQDWDMEIEKAVEAADAVIVCLSRKAVSKEGYVQRELRFVLDIALEKPEEVIFVIPVRLEDCQMPRRLRGWQYADYFPMGRRSWAYQRLLQALRKRHEQQKPSGNSEKVRDRKNSRDEARVRSTAQVTGSKFVSNSAKLPELNSNRPERPEVPAKTEKPDFESIMSSMLALGLDGLLGIFLGLVFYFLPWNIDASGFELSFGELSYGAYSPAFLFFPFTCLLILSVYLYHGLSHRPIPKFGYFLLDCGCLMAVVLLAHMPWAISIELFQEARFGLWGEILSIAIITIAGLYRLFTQGAASASRRDTLLKRRVVIYPVLLIILSFVVYFADDI